MILTYRCRLLPLKSQHRALERLCNSQRALYNAGLEERIDCYRKTGKTRTYIDQCKALTQCRRELPDMGELPVNLQRWTLKRLDEAFQGFFRRVKERRGKAGFPRFRGKGRWEAFGFAEFSGIRFDGKRLRFAGMPGGLKLRLHRPLPDGADIRSCVFRRDGRGWHVCLAVAVEAAEKRAVASAVGIDLGLKVFAYCSDNVVIPNPRIAQRAEKELRVRQRALARCKRGSNRRRKVRAQVARLHGKIADTGSHLIRVDPTNTSQKCSGCGELVPKLLAARTHACPSCGLVIDRDYNASLNILRAGIGAGALNVIGLR